MTVITACHSRPMSPGAVRVLSASPTQIEPTASAQEGAPEICNTWKLTESQAGRFFALSKEIDSQTYHHTYDTAPCKVVGRVSSAGETWQFTINGAAKAKWVRGDAIRYFGCEAVECGSLVLWPYATPDDL